MRWNVRESGDSDRRGRSIRAGRRVFPMGDGDGGCRRHPWRQSVRSARRGSRKRDHETWQTEYATKGSLPAEEPVLRMKGSHSLPIVATPQSSSHCSARMPASLGCRVPARAHLRDGPGDYVALLAYLPMTASIESRLQRTRHRIRDTTRTATSVGLALAICTRRTSAQRWSKQRRVRGNYG